MRLEYSLSLEDLSKGFAIITNKALWKGKWPRVLKFAKFNSWLGAGVFTLAALLSFLSREVKWGVAAIIILAIWFWIFRAYKKEHYALNEIVFKLLYRKKSLEGLVGRHTLEVSEAELIESNEFNRTISRVDKLNGIKESDDFIFIMLNDITCHIIPKKNLDHTNLEALRRMMPIEKYLSVSSN